MCDAKMILRIGVLFAFTELNPAMSWFNASDWPVRVGYNVSFRT